MRTEAELKASLDEMAKWYDREGMPTLDWSAVQYELAAMLRDKLKKEVQARYAELHTQEMHTLLGLVRDRMHQSTEEAHLSPDPTATPVAGIKARPGYVPEPKQGKGKRK